MTTPDHPSLLYWHGKNSVALCASNLVLWQMPNVINWLLSSAAITTAQQALIMTLLQLSDVLLFISTTMTLLICVVLTSQEVQSPEDRLGALMAWFSGSITAVLLANLVHRSL